MRLIKLTIHNITSIEDAVIDFENGPLADDSLFLMTGITGSGKSSILDAICLALYCTTPRMKESKSEKYVDENETFNAGKESGSTVDSTDVRMYMRRGAEEAFIELVFSDKDDRVLTSRWSCCRAKRAPYRIKDYTIELTGADGELLAKGKREFAEMIIERLGMTFEQFCRTTMLAQGEFTKFLKSTVDEKSAILEKVTGTEIYTRIGAEISRTYSEKKRVVSDLELQMGAITLLDEAAKTAIGNEIHRLQSLSEELSKRKTRLSEQHKWLVDRRECERRLAEYTSRLAQLRNREQSEEYVAERRLVEDWDKCAVRESWLRKESLSADLQRLEQQDAMLRQRYAELLRGIRGEEQKYAELVARRDACRTYLEERSGYADMFRQMDSIMMLFHQTDSSHRQAEDNRLRWQQAMERIRVEEQEIGGQVLQREKLQQLDAKNREELQQAQDELRKYDLKALQTRQTAIRHEITALQELVELHAKYMVAAEQLDKVTVEHRAAREGVAAGEKQLAKLEALYMASEEEFRTLEQAVERQKLMCDDVMKTLRSQLKAGDTCPLCGQQVTEVLCCGEAFESVLAPMKQHLESQRRKRDQTYCDCSDKRAELVMGRRDVARLDDKKLMAEKELQAASVRYEECPAGAPYRGRKNVVQLVGEDIKTLEQTMLQLNAQIQQVGECQDNVVKCNKQCTVSLARLEKADKEIRAAETRIAEYKTNAEKFKANIAVHEETVKQNLKRLDTMISVPQWQAMYHRSSEAFCRDLQRQTDEFAAKTEMLAALSEKMRLEEVRQEGLRSRVTYICEKKPSWVEIVISEAVSLPDIASSAHRLSDAVTDHVSHVETRRCELSVEESRIGTYLQQSDAVSEERIAQLAAISPETVNRVKNAHTAYLEQLTALKANEEAVRKDLEHLEQDKPQFEEGMNDLETLACHLTALEQEQSEVARAIGGEQNKLDRDAEENLRHQAVADKVSKAKAEREKWYELNTLFGVGEGKNFRIIAQSYILKELIRSANRYLTTLTSRYELVCQSGSLVILLKDNDAGGVVRPVTTISGGESFLVSLSLALGLSALGSSNVAMDILFIDEGFGTLDSTHLNTVMDTLEKLHLMGGRKVGVISHVESLKERLTTQIRLVRENTTKSRVEVVSTLGKE